MNAAVSDSEDSLLVSSPYELRVGQSEGLSEFSVKSALESGECGFVHSFTTGSAVDGPGVRVVAWLAGCQFRCIYCHNPDTWKLSNGKPVTITQAVQAVQKYRRGLQVMKGGLTISGGEPLLQQRFVLNVFTEVRKVGIHTALDTNGYLGSRLSDQDLNQVDLVLLDLKAFSPELHRRLTGMDNQPVLEFARRLADGHRPVWVRFVLVPGFTDDMAEVERIAKFAGGLGNVARVDVLPFHQMGAFKWEKLDIPYELRRVKPPTLAQTREAIAAFLAQGLEAY